MENAGENVKVRAREAVGYPETPEDHDAMGRHGDGKGCFFLKKYFNDIIFTLW
jgi:hypothetical protein